MSKENCAEEAMLQKQEKWTRNMAKQLVMPEVKMKTETMEEYAQMIKKEETKSRWPLQMKKRAKKYNNVAKKYNNVEHVKYTQRRFEWHLKMPHKSA